MKKVKFGTIKNDEIIPAKIPVNLKATSIDDQFSLQLNSVYSIDDDVPGQAVPISPKDEWDYLKDISFQDVDPEQIQILIGADAPAALIPDGFRKGGNGMPYASKTPFGWALFGLYEDESAIFNILRIGHTKANKCDAEMDDILKQFWETESFGTKLNLQSPIFMNEREIFQTLDKETTWSLSSSNVVETKC